MGNGTLPYGPSYRAHPRLYHKRRAVPGEAFKDAIRIRKANVVLLIQTKHGRLPHHCHSYGLRLASGRGPPCGSARACGGCGCSNGGILGHESSHCLCGVWLRGCCVLFSRLTASNGRFAVRIGAPRRRSQDLVRADLSYAVRAPCPIGSGAFGNVYAQRPCSADGLAKAGAFAANWRTTVFAKPRLRRASTCGGHATDGNANEENTDEEKAGCGRASK
jgi:hypothetical protein